MSELIKAVGYVRCSTEMQEDSPEQQKKEILAFAAKQGYEIIEWYVDFGKSGTNFINREEFQRLLHDVENKPTFKAVIAYDESRWGRAIKPDENTYWRYHFELRGVDVLLVKTAIDPKHEFSPMLKAFESVLASQYSKKLSELTLRGAMSNGRFSSGGTAPYGYIRAALNSKTGVVRKLTDGEWCVKKQEKVYWVQGDPIEVKTVNFIFESRAKGDSYLYIAKVLNDQDIPCAKRGRWKNRDQKWSVGTIKSIIENPAYFGARRYNKISSSEIIARKKELHVNSNLQHPKWNNDPNDWILTENAHEAIVSKLIWEKANKIDCNTLPKKANGHVYRSRYLLTGLIKCSCCKFPFQGWSGSANGKKYYRYIDGGWQSKRVCSFMSIPQDEIEGFALGAVKRLLMEPRLVEKMEKSLQNLVKIRSTVNLDGVAIMRNRIIELDNKINNLLSLVESGATKGPTIRTRLEELENEKMRIEEQLQIEQVVKQTNATQVSDVVKEVTLFVRDFDSRMELAPIEERKIIMKQSIQNIWIDRDKMVARFSIRRIPAVSPLINMLLDKGSQATIVSTESARNRS